MKKLLGTALAVAALGTGASAATLTGDTVTKDVFNDGNSIFATESFLVGAGIDETDGSVNYDLDASGGTQLMIDTGSGCGMYACSGVTDIIFSDLDFSGGAMLTGFNVLADPQLGITASVVDGSTLKLTFNEASVTPGNFLIGEYVTSMSPVPVPAAGFLLLGGLGGLAAMRRRKKS